MADLLTLATLRKLADERALDAEVLLAKKRYSSAYYLAGYAIELGLKACFAKGVKARAILPKRTGMNFYEHSFPTLLSITGLGVELEARARADTFFAARWAVVATWTVESRYEIIPRMKAKEMLDAVSHTKHGVLPWIKTRW